MTQGRLWLMLVEVLLYVHRNRGRQLSHSSWALTLADVYLCHSCCCGAELKAMVCTIDCLQCQSFPLFFFFFSFFFFVPTSIFLKLKFIAIAYIVSNYCSMQIRQTERRVCKTDCWCLFTQITAWRWWGTFSTVYSSQTKNKQKTPPLPLYPQNQQQNKRKYIHRL